MKSIKPILITLPIAAVFFLFSFNISSCTNSGSGSGGSSDTSGNKNGPKFITTDPVSAGSRLLLECASQDCNVAIPNGGKKTILVCTIPYDIPANTELIVRIVPKGDPANTEKKGVGK